MPVKFALIALIKFKKSNEQFCHFQKECFQKHQRIIKIKITSN